MQGDVIYLKLKNQHDPNSYHQTISTKKTDPKKGRFLNIYLQ